jgi:hypothetical protein
MPNVNAPPSSGLMQAMAKLIREKAPGVADAVGSAADTMLGPENPPVHMLLQALSNADPMGVMGMGMAMGPVAKGMLGRTYKLSTPIKNAAGKSTSRVRVLEEGANGHLRLADMVNAAEDSPIYIRAKRLAEIGTEEMDPLAAAASRNLALDPDSGKPLGWGEDTATANKMAGERSRSPYFINSNPGSAGNMMRPKNDPSR